ncbi:hypothetical protein [Sphingobium sp. RAC03]|uniref:hypothetical protein n=1 Tax=Sphingobium sp. RAC03 TaxID=1843368 RepID=UPI000857F853|nr:hypothetical protein [Sphingobium sp. RAC03]AOF97687.1 hypothetical protein BSY17_2638 [Sphingobium sp. RAC03]
MERIALSESISQSASMDDAMRADLERDYQSQSQEAAERLRFSIGFAVNGLQSLTLINGGALVALFTFVGAAGSVRFNIAMLWWSFACFAFGLVCTILAYLWAHLSQDCYYVAAQGLAWDAQDRLKAVQPDRVNIVSHVRGDLYRLGGVACALLALFGFVAGAGFALSSVVTA